MTKQAKQRLRPPVLIPPVLVYLAAAPNKDHSTIVMNGLAGRLKSLYSMLTAADGSTLNDLNAMSQVRYLFSGNPKCASILYNDFNLPASPFITIVE